MQRILGYIALAIIAIVGLHSVMQINTVSDVIAEGNRKTDAEIAQRKADEKAREEERAFDGETFDGENYDVPEPTDFASDRSETANYESSSGEQ